MTKIFCDIDDLKLIKKFNNKKIVKGFTTNPSLMRMAGAKSYENYSKKILNICKKKPVSLEVFADDLKDMISQGIKINTWGKNVYVKVPIINSKNKLARKFKNVEILWASVREPYNYLQSKQIGCDIITIPPSIIEKIEKFGKNFQQLTLETVKTFLADSKKSKFKI
jgi:transaldolase